MSVSHAPRTVHYCLTVLHFVHNEQRVGEQAVTRGGPPTLKCGQFIAVVRIFMLTTGVNHPFNPNKGLPITARACRITKNLYTARNSYIRTCAPKVVASLLEDSRRTSQDRLDRYGKPEKAIDKLQFRHPHASLKTNSPLHSWPENHSKSKNTDSMKQDSMNWDSDASCHDDWRFGANRYVALGYKCRDSKCRDSKYRVYKRSGHETRDCLVRRTEALPALMSSADATLTSFSEYKGS